MTISSQGLYNNLNTFAWNALEHYPLQDYEWNELKKVIELYPDKVTNEIQALYDNYSKFQWDVSSRKIQEEDWLVVKDLLEYHLDQTNIYKRRE